MKRHLKPRYKSIQAAAAMAAAIGTASVLIDAGSAQPFNLSTVILAAAGYAVAAGLYWIEAATRNGEKA